MPSTRQASPSSKSSPGSASWPSAIQRASSGSAPRTAVANRRAGANKEIGRDLAIAEKTVKTHVSSILGKLGVQSRTQAARYAARVGLVPLDQLGETCVG